MVERNGQILLFSFQIQGTDEGSLAGSQFYHINYLLSVQNPLVDVLNKRGR